MTMLALSLLEPTGLVAAGFVAGGALGVAFVRTVRRERRTGATARHRTGRLPLPSRVADLSVSDEPALDRVNAFADRLAELPLDSWLEVGRALAIEANVPPTRSAARAILDATIGDRDLSVAAWYARDAVDTAVWLAGNSRGRMSPADRGALAGAHGAAETAALALLSEEFLSARDFAVLVAPYADLVPASTSHI